MGLFDTIALPQAKRKIQVNDGIIRAAGIGDRTALNDRLNDPNNWKGTDDDNAWMRWRIRIKAWFAFSTQPYDGFTATFVFLPGIYLLPFTVWFTGWSWWYLFPVAILPVFRQWRLYPITLFAIKGKGPWRFEASDGSSDGHADRPNVIFAGICKHVSEKPMYLSRVQRWTRWHVAIHWPALVTFHWYFKDVYVPTPEQHVDTDGHLLNGYRGWHRDADEVYWGDGAFLGKVFK